MQTSNSGLTSLGLSFHSCRMGVIWMKWGYIYEAFSTAPGRSQQGNYFSLLAFVSNEMSCSGKKICDQNEVSGSNFTGLFQDRPSNILWRTRGRCHSYAGIRTPHMDRGQGEAVLVRAIWDSDQEQFLNSTWKNLLDQFPASTFPASRTGSFRV